ncbi:stress response protein NST1-like [Mangifera indica]|uniref:stress response protein NST1-like n=1 Tax=Mangifera indica TaxID=29780 RepID=UPI001CFB5EA9|nr:stress response protein NST1-like [Mangifera indica]
MEPSGLNVGLFSDTSSVMLGLEMPLQPQQNPQIQNPHNLQSQSQMLAAYSQSPHHDTDHHHHSQPQSHQSSKQRGYWFTPKPKQQLSPLSDEDELGFAPDESAGDGKRKASPWHRMKWTDSMVRLLIMAVFYIGDEAGSEGNDKKMAGALLQKKGKWKSVSRAMMEKGFYVSPQQCEDKFNDLNKRYKRVNEILGKGTACRVVENQSLLDNMDLSPKMKEEVKKLLNSKHLFFREMCAYHNSCGHGSVTSVATGANRSLEVVADPSQVQHQQSQQKRCLHSSENALGGASSNRIEIDGSKMAKVGSEEENEEDDYSDDDDDDDDEDEAIDGILRGQNGHGQEDDNDNHEKTFGKKARKGVLSGALLPLMEQFNGEVMSVIQDGAKSAWEKKQWMKMRLLQLEEQQVSYEYQAFELEKQRIKWVKFSSKKKREMEKAKLENERRRLENQRMVLVIRQKEVELLDHHHHQQQQNSSNKRSEPSSITG